MFGTQNETGLKAEGREQKAEGRTPRTSRLVPRAFTLTELLVVITIIAILAGLITGAALNAMNKANQARITLELQQLGNAMDDLKNDLGSYPPNGMGNVTDYNNNSMFNTVQSDFERMFKKAFPRNNEPIGLIRALVGNTTGGVGNPSTLTDGMTPSEALVFWLGGFSQDTQYPISGTGGPSFVDGSDSGTTLDVSDEVLEDRNFRYEFDLGRLFPRDSTTGAFSGRWIQYDDPRTGDRRQINLWTYTPPGSQLPVIYFDTSRHDPNEYDPNLADMGGDPIYALKKLREGFSASATPTVSDITFVSPKKYQILHAGIDDIWGDAFASFDIKQASSANNANNLLLVPTGPFIGDIADTVGNFMTGTLEDEQE